MPGIYDIPPNLRWDPLNPPLRNDCSGMVELHEKDCDGKCGKSPITELECRLVNENRNWGRAGMRTEQVQLDLFRMSNQIQALINMVRTLLENPDSLDEEFRMVTIERMEEIRIANEDAVKRARLGVAPKGILGPNGQRLN